MATGQVLTDLAVELAKQGHDVTAIAADRGYDDPSTRFPRRETWQGITIIRIPSLGLGKSTKWRRALNFGTFLIFCALRLLMLPRFDVVIALTSPPLISLLGAVFTQLKGGRFLFWVMDLNPDEAIAAGWLKQDSLIARALTRILVYSMKHAHTIVVLDRFARERVLKKGIDAEKIQVLPPWSHDNEIQFDLEGRELFRRQHQLNDKFVVMYSGNHSPCHPLDTLLEAARRLADRQEFAFCFVGGGSEQQKVKDFTRANQLKNIECLPYQPLTKLSQSLSAADLHAVVMGDRFAGIVHPCKVYNILSIGSPFLYIGPSESHVMDIAAEVNGFPIFSARHGEVEKVVQHIVAAASNGSKRGNLSESTRSKFARKSVLPQMIVIIEGK